VGKLVKNDFIHKFPFIIFALLNKNKMSRRKRKNQTEDIRVEDYKSGYMSRLKLKDLKRACIMRGMPFSRIVRYGVHEMQSWLYKNFDNKINPVLLDEYDEWFQDQVEDPVHVLLKMAYYTEDENGNVKRERRNTFMMGVEKTKAEIAAFKPKRGSMKELTFELIRAGKPTKEVIKEVMDQFQTANEGSIKSWASKARKSVKAQKELDNE